MTGRRGTRRLLLVRHGRVELSARGPGDFRDSPRGRQWDPPLGPAGREQAGQLAARLQLMDPPAGLYSSPFRRCLETARPYARAIGVDPVVGEGVGEVFIGEWEGLSFEEIVGTDEELARRFRDQEAMFSMAPGGESGEELRARVGGAVEAILERHGEGNVVIVTHGGVINAYLGGVLGIEHDMFFLPDNASINTVVVEGGERRPWFLNDVRHLTDPQVFVPLTSGH
ncbi:MAG: histidine phosphatase family protein [Actinobacteria bacterium]|nr:histidine phosphatase family protein [Actinomycetota bacterium]